VLAGSHAVKAIALGGPVRRWGRTSVIIAGMRAVSMADQEAFERSILRRRWLNALHRMGIATVGDLRVTPEKRLLEIPMIGPKAVADIAEALRDPSMCSTVRSRCSGSRRRV
jgi:DNA-directed RNA polymerase alpha subunit